MSGASRWLLLVLLLGAAIHRSDYHRHFVATDPIAEAPYGDSLVYLHEAKRQFVDREPAAFYKHPLYTAVLHVADAGLPHGRARIRDMQWILGLGVLAMAFLMAHARGGWLAGLTAFLLLALYPPLLFEESKLLDTTVGVFTLTLAVFLFDRWLLARRRRDMALLAAGVAFGVAALARSPALLVAALLAVIAWRSSGWRPALCLALGTALPVLPVTVHNVRAEGDLVLVNASDAFTFLAGNNANSVGIYALPPGYPDGVLRERLYEKEMARQALGREPTLREQRRYTYGRAIEYLDEHRERIPGLLFDKLRFALSSYEVDDNYSMMRERQRYGLMRGMVVPFGVLLVLGLVGLVLGARGRPSLVAPLLVTLVVLIVFYVTSRFRLVAAPMLAVAAGVGVERLLGLPGPRGRGGSPSVARKVLATGVGLALALVLWAAPLPVPRDALDASERYFGQMLDLHAARTAVQDARPVDAAGILAAGIAHAGTAQALGRDLTDVLWRASRTEIDAMIAAVRAAAAGDANVERILAEVVASR